MRIQLGGQDRELKYTYGDLRAMEREAGMGVPKIVSDDQRGYNTMCLLVWAGLRHENKRLTLDQVDLWLGGYLHDGGNFEALGILVNGSLMESGVLGVQPVEETKLGNG